MKTLAATVTLLVLAAASSPHGQGRWGWVDDLIRRAPSVGRGALLARAEAELARRTPLFDTAGRQVAKTEKETNAFTQMITGIRKELPEVSASDVWEVLDKLGITDVEVRYDRSTCVASITTPQGRFETRRMRFDWCKLRVEATELPSVVDRLLGR